mmetsp:Transcript_14192/g.34458  ORF Transcript_14192/g.34458 Transcript_14192/m.34458 type:complete len:94 (-) Transcript_14192:456-737(-)
MALVSERKMQTAKHLLQSVLHIIVLDEVWDSSNGNRQHLFQRLLPPVNASIMHRLTSGYRYDPQSPVLAITGSTSQLRNKQSISVVYPQIQQV